MLSKEEAALVADVIETHFTVDGTKHDKSYTCKYCHWKRSAKRQLCIGHILCQNPTAASNCTRQVAKLSEQEHANLLHAQALLQGSSTKSSSDAASQRLETTLSSLVSASGSKRPKSDGAGPAAKRPPHAGGSSSGASSAPSLFVNPPIISMATHT
jgi:hypothetical protein